MVVPPASLTSPPKSELTCCWNVSWRLDPWPFVIAAYAVTALAIAVLSLLSWRAMRRAEAAVEANRRA